MRCQNEFTERYFLKIGLFCLVAVLLTGCVPLSSDDIAQVVAVKASNCWPCAAYKSVWNAIGGVATNAFPMVCSAALNLLGMGLMFWLMMTGIKLVSALKEPNLKEFIPKINAVLFKAIVVAVILSSSTYVIQILDMIVTPVLLGFVSLSRAVMFAEPTIAKHFASLSSLNDVAVGDYVLFSSTIGSQLQDVIYRLYLAFNSGIALGARMMLSIDTISWVLGLLVMLTFFFMMLFFPLLYLEGFITLGVVILLFPILLVGWVFPSTKSYIQEAGKILFQAAAQILITSIYVAVIVNVLKSYSSSFSLIKQITDPALLLGLKNMSNNGIAFFALILCMFKLSNDIPKVTSFLVGQQINRSVIMRKFMGFMNIITGVGKVAVGAALAGAGMGIVGKSMMQDGATSAKNAVMSSFRNSNEESRGLSDAEKAGKPSPPR